MNLYQREVTLSCNSYEPGDTSTAKQHRRYYNSLATGAVLMDSAFTASLDERSGVADKAIQLHHDSHTTTVSPR
jgi:hypothetical protein